MIGNKLLMKISLCLGEKPPNPVRDWGGKLDGSIDEKPPSPDGTSRRITDDRCRRVELSKDEASMKNLLTQ